MNNPEPNRYHHGDLAETLMDAALKHIAAEGTERLSLRALARESGVSATAPYRHFPSKRCLLAALATRGFRELERETRVVLRPSMALEDRFLAMGRAYVHYAVTNPTRYNLMFGSVLDDFSSYDMLEQASIDCYSVVLDVLGELIAARGMELTPVELGGVVWAGVHGLASLMIHKGSSPADHDESISAPRASLTYLHANPEKALRILFGPLLDS